MPDGPTPTVSSTPNTKAIIETPATPPIARHDDNNALAPALWLTPLIATLGLLASQMITAHTTQKIKKLELAYARKADAYKELMQKTSVFCFSPLAENSYIDFLTAYYSCRIVTSKTVESVMAGSEGIATAAKNLHDSALAKDVQGVKLNQDALNLVQQKCIVLMRDDLVAVSGSIERRLKKG